MTETGGRPEDRPGWEGFPGADGAAEADPFATGPVVGPGTAAYDPPAAFDPPLGGYDDPSVGRAQSPVPPQFPVVPPEDLTAPVPLVGVGGADAAPAGTRRSHRAGSGGAGGAGRGNGRRTLLYGVAAAAALVLGGFAFWAFGGDVRDDGPPAVAAPVAAPVVPSVPTSSPTQSVISPGVSTSPLATGSALATPKSSTAAATSPTGKPSASSSPKPTSTGQAAPVRQPVLVLNNTTITGLAARVAADVRAKNWTVIKTENWKGAPVTATTIYYLPGAKNKASAKLFAQQFDVVTAVKPALPGMTRNLTLVLARDAA